MTGLLLRAPAGDHRALRAHDLTGLHRWGGTLTMAGTDPPAPRDAADSAGVRARATRQPTLPTPSRSRR